MSASFPDESTARFWICEVSGGQMLRGHAEGCPHLARWEKANQPARHRRWPFESKLQTIAAAKRMTAPFRWCKRCEHYRDVGGFTELNSQFDQARLDYRAALATVAERRNDPNKEGTQRSRLVQDLEAASDRLEQLLRAYLLFLRKNAAAHAKAEAR